MTAMTDPQWIADFHAICALKARYCRFLDTKDWEGWTNCFTEDLVLDTTPSGGTRIEGRDAALAMVRPAIEPAKTAHQVHSPEIEIHGDTATGIWAMQDRVVWSAERSLTGYGHYHEDYRRTPDGWKIARQTLTRLHMDMAGF
jgi:ketosteroid isomerase-like protein